MHTLLVLGVQYFYFTIPVTRLHPAARQINTVLSQFYYVIIHCDVFEYDQIDHKWRGNHCLVAGKNEISCQMAPDWKPGGRSQQTLATCHCLLPPVSFTTHFVHDIYLHSWRWILTRGLKINNITTRVRARTKYSMHSMHMRTYIMLVLALTQDLSSLWQPALFWHQCDSDIKASLLICT